MILPFDQIKGEKLTSEQQSYLEGLFAGLKNRGFRFDDAIPNPVANPTASSEMIFEERVKHELHPLDAFPLLLEHAAANKAPDRENIFRFKWNGLFYLTPAKEAFMCRLCIPAGQLKSFQLRELARIANELTPSGRADVPAARQENELAWRTSPRNSSRSCANGPARASWTASVP